MADSEQLATDTASLWDLPEEEEQEEEELRHNKDEEEEKLEKDEV